jgi:glucose/arabinose dehydrogenase
LNEDGSAPEDNPFIGRAGYKPEIYALGIRNAIGLIVHPETGELWETDNGPQGGDEINIIKRGLNYGWPVVTYGRAYTTDPDGIRSGLTGAQRPTAHVGARDGRTIHVLQALDCDLGNGLLHRQQVSAVEGKSYGGGLAGTQLSRFVFNERGLESRREPLLLELRQRIRDVRQGPDGLVYLTTDMRDGAILKLEPVAEL